jgi:phage terminase large subunit
VAGLIVQIPYRPRLLQRAIHEGMDRARFGVVVCHRRFGKTVGAVNHLQKAAMTCTKERPRFAYLAPTYSQAKSVSLGLRQALRQPGGGPRGERIRAPH